MTSSFTPPPRLHGSEPFVGVVSDAAPTIPPPTVSDFWRWAMSDLLSNTTRGVLAEFLVGSALGIAMAVRREWDPVDLVTSEGHRVEVKSAAYVQSWEQSKESTVQFSVAPTAAWDETKRRYEGVSKRQADVYVFALLAERDRARVNPMDLAQWQFFVVATKQLDDALGDQRSLSLSRLGALARRKVDYAGLAVAVRECLAAAVGDPR